ncbi:gamma carbonic anhydrase family protein [Candidatus Riflebacteria bacterium]
MIYKIGKKKPGLGKKCFIAPSAEIIGDVVLGENCSVWFQTTIRGDVNYIKIGKDCNIQDHCCLHVTKDRYSLTIGDGVTIAHKVMLHGCSIGDHCLIGMGAIIMDGVNIGDECIIGAGSLLLQGMNIAKRSLVLGKPARIVRTLKKEEIEYIYDLKENYLVYKDEYLKSFKEVK